MKTVSAFPETVEYKSCTATVYRHKHRDAERFEVRYYDLDGSLQRVTFATHAGATTFANTVVEELRRRERTALKRGAMPVTETEPPPIDHPRTQTDHSGMP